MAWSYSSAILDSTSAGLLNTVRLLIGDTQTLDQQLDNAEIDFALAQNGDNVYYAGAWASRAIASKYSRQVTSEVSGALKAQYSDLAKQYLQLAENLDYQGKTSGGSMGALAGGTTISGINSVRADTNRVENSFRRDRFKNPPSYQTPEYE